VLSIRILDYLHSMCLPVSSNDAVSISYLLTSFNSLPEMAGGWGGELMRREAEFMVLDGM